MKATITGKLQHLGESEILTLIPKDTIARIKATDETPEFRAYAIAHEGTATPKMVGFGSVAMQYLRDAIFRLHERLTIGTPVFHGHGETNDSSGRESIGEIVGKTLRDVGGKLYDIAVTYIKPEYRSTPLDIASIEADVEFNPNPTDGKLTAVDIGEITGLALGNSAVEKPAFAGATLLAAVQAFVSKSEEKDTNAMTLEEIKSACKELKVKPDDLFENEDLLKVSAVKDKIDLTGREAARNVKNADAEKILQLTEERDSLKAQVFKSKATSVFDVLSTERKLSEKQKTFAARNLADFQTNATDDDGLKRDLNGFLDKRLNEYNEFAKMFGIQTEDNPAQKDHLPGNPPADGPISNDYSDPKTNPMIPQE